MDAECSETLRQIKDEIDSIEVLDSLRGSPGLSECDRKVLEEIRLKLENLHYDLSDRYAY